MLLQFWMQNYRTTLIIIPLIHCKWIAVRLCTRVSRDVPAWVLNRHYEFVTLKGDQYDWSCCWYWRVSLDDTLIPRYRWWKELEISFRWLTLTHSYPFHSSRIYAIILTKSLPQLLTDPLMFLFHLRRTPVRILTDWQLYSSPPQQHLPCHLHCSAARIW
jgi:hypothetical protein